MDEIVERTDGVALFIEELTKAVVEAAISGADAGKKTVSSVPAASSAVPATLHASLMARLDRLGSTAKEVLQFGAAIGRDFSYELLAAVGQWTNSELRSALSRLVDAGLVFQRGEPPQVSFLFKHALVQDTAYSILLRGPRRSLHARIACALEERFHDAMQARPETLAHHFTEAGLSEKAVEYWFRAGRQSVAKSALVEAIVQLRRGLALIADLPDTREHKLQELDLQVTLANALIWTKGPVHLEVVEAFGRAHSLISQTGRPGTIVHFSVLYGLWIADYLGDNPRAALDRANEFLILAQSQTETGLLLTGHRLVGTMLIIIGDYPAALSHLECAVALNKPEGHRTLAFQFGADIGVTALCVWAWALWHRGYPEQARKAADEALRQARRSAHLLTLAYALLYIGRMAISARRAVEVEELANELVALASEHRFAFFLRWGLMFQGWAMAQSGKGGAAVERVREGLAAMHVTGMHFLGLLAEALALTGEIADGLIVLAEALATTEASGARGTDAELYRLRGDLQCRLPSPDRTAAEASFRTALAVAREQGTRGFELRAAVSLARLLSDQGRREEARDLLAPVYCWFTEGFDTPDLKDAKALLEALQA